LGVRLTILIESNLTYPEEVRNVFSVSSRKAVKLRNEERCVSCEHLVKREELVQVSFKTVF